MTSIAPPSEPTRKTAFTNDDLVRMRGGQGAPAVAMPAAATAAPSMPPANAAFVPVASNEAGQDKLREWTKRVRDAEDDVQEAQAKVRRAQTEVDARRAHALAVASDADAHDKAQRDVTDSLEDLEKAERKLSEKQRDLDETRAQARAAGIRFE
jgi:TolA-binding protein